jgi:hypothetical protein
LWEFSQNCNGQMMTRSGLLLSSLLVAIATAANPSQAADVTTVCTPDLAAKLCIHLVQANNDDYRVDHVVVEAYGPEGVRAAASSGYLVPHDRRFIFLTGGFSILGPGSDTWQYEYYVVWVSPSGDGAVQLGGTVLRCLIRPEPNPVSCDALD